jgi:hypothetical protein
LVSLGEFIPVFHRLGQDSALFDDTDNGADVCGVGDGVIGFDGKVAASVAMGKQCLNRCVRIPWGLECISVVGKSGCRGDDAVVQHEMHEELGRGDVGKSLDAIFQGGDVLSRDGLKDEVGEVLGHVDGICEELNIRFVFGHEEFISVGGSTHQDDGALGVGGDGVCHASMGQPW